MHTSFQASISLHNKTLIMLRNCGSDILNESARSLRTIGTEQRKLIDLISEYNISSES